MSETVIGADGSETKIAPAMGKFERYLTLSSLVSRSVSTSNGNP